MWLLVRRGAFFVLKIFARADGAWVEDTRQSLDDIQRCALMIYHPNGMDDIPPAADDIQRVALI